MHAQYIPDLPDEKQCSRCGNNFPLSAYCHDKSKPDGRRPECADCRKAHREKTREQIQERRQRYYSENREAIAARAKIYNGGVADQERERKRQHYLAHKDAILAAAREYRAKNKEQIRQQKQGYRKRTYEQRAQSGRRYYQENRAKKRLYHRHWQRANPDKIRQHGDKRRAAKLAGGSYTAAEWQQLKARFGNCCLCCGRQEPAIALSADHVIPLVLGGANTISNIQPLCLQCNFRKHTRTTDYRP